MSKKWALVTGASGGLGEALAREMAMRGRNVALAARGEPAMQALASELRERHGVQTRVGLVEAAFAPSRSTSGDDPAAAFLAAYVAHLDGHRELLRLDALRPTLEHGLDFASLAEFKRTFVERLVAGGALIDRRLGLRGGKASSC